MLRRAIGHKSRGPPQWRVIVTRGSTAGPKSTREFIRAKESICSKPRCIGTIRQRGSEPFAVGGNHNRRRVEGFRGVVCDLRRRNEQCRSSKGQRSSARRCISARRGSQSNMRCVMRRSIRHSCSWAPTVRLFRRRSALARSPKLSQVGLEPTAIWRMSAYRAFRSKPLTWKPFADVAPGAACASVRLLRFAERACHGREHPP